MKTVLEKNRVLLLEEDGKQVGYVTFPSVSSQVVNIDHVFVHPDYRGQQIASQLMELALSQIEQQGKQVILTCPYAQGWLPKHPQWSHLLARDIKFSHH